MVCLSQFAQSFMSFSALTGISRIMLLDRFSLAEYNRITLLLKERE